MKRLLWVLMIGLMTSHALVGCSPAPPPEPPVEEEIIENEEVGATP